MSVDITARCCVSSGVPAWTKQTSVGHVHTLVRMHIRGAVNASSQLTREALVTHIRVASVRWGVMAFVLVMAATLVLLLRGMAKGEPTARLARELGMSRKQSIHSGSASKPT